MFILDEGIPSRLCTDLVTDYLDLKIYKKHANENKWVHGKYSNFVNRDRGFVSEILTGHQLSISNFNIYLSQVIETQNLYTVMYKTVKTLNFSVKNKI